LFSQNLVINEFCAKNENVLTDVDFNQFSDWIELYNLGHNNVDLSGWFLTDDQENHTRWQFPANSIIESTAYLIVWADDQNTVIEALHSSFKLSGNGGWIGLFDPDTNLVDQITYPDQITDISYGRVSQDWAFFYPPTPLSANGINAYYSNEREEKPDFSVASGFYISGTQLELSGDGNGDAIHYTLDGSYPDEDSPVYTDPIVLSGNTVVRARIYGDLLPGKVNAHSYFVGTNKSLPVVSMIISPDFLWSDSIGIFNDFEIEDRVEWERVSKLQYFRDKNLKFETNNEIRLFGATAFNLPQKSFAVFAEDPVEYKIFDRKEVDVFDSFIMRSSSDDWAKTMFRDGFIQSVVSENLPIDYMAFQPTVLYINGEYFGIFNLREKYNENYLKNVHGVNRDSIDLLALSYWGLGVQVLAGSNTTYYQLLDYLNSNDITNNEVFDGINEYLDIEDYTHYIITQIYIANWSYKHNIKTWRKNNVTDGFKWLLFDTDRGYTNAMKEVFQLVYDCDTIFKQLVQNVDYRNHLIQQTCSHMNATFRKSCVTGTIDSLRNKILDEMPDHINRWAPEGGVQSMDAWEEAIEVLTDFAKERQDILGSRINDFFSLDGTVEVNLKKTSERGGHVYIEDVPIPYSDSVHTYFRNIPVTLVAKPKLGYEFIGWENISAEDTLVYTFTDNDSIHALFEADCDIPQTITGEEILLKECSPYYFNNDVIIEEGATLLSEPGVEIYFGEDVQLLVYGNLDFTGTESEPIIIQGQEGETWKYIKSEGGDLIIKQAVIYSGQKAISFSDGGSLTIDNCEFYESDANVSDLVSGYNTDVIIENSVFYCNPENNKKDCIDCDGIDYGLISGNIFYDVSDDGIDIGTNSSNVTIQYNEMYACESMGISIGESSEVTIYRNIITGCNGGIQVHTDAVADILNNTLYNNEVGIRCYHYEDPPYSGGIAFVKNTIFSQCGEDFTTHPNSQIEISYSLSDQILHPGDDNINDDPKFVNETINDFNLQANSPCIDAGDENSSLDPDNTRADIGALYFNQDTSIIEYESAIAYYPNPFRNKTTVKLQNNQLIQSVQIFSLLGELILSENNLNSDKYTINISNKGLLFVVVNDSDGNRFVLKLISR